MTAERDHRKYSPSGADANTLCPGRPRLLERVPRHDTKYSIEGTKAHAVLDAALKNKVRSAKIAHLEHSALFAEDLDEWDNNFYFSIQVALDHIWSIMDAYPDAILFTERFVNPPLPAAPGEGAGYCDVAIWVPSIRTLFVFDYKHGAGVAKAVKGNRQVLQYAAGFLYEANAAVDVRELDTVVLGIIQPRAHHVEGIIREIELTPFDVWCYLDEMNDYVQACEAPDAPLIPGDEQCRFCAASAVCPAREAAALQVAHKHFHSIMDVKSSSLQDPSMMDLERVGLVRFHAATLRKWLDDVDQRAYELAMQGFHIPGAKLVEAAAKRRYYGETQEVARRLAGLLGDRDAEEAMNAYADIRRKYPVLERLFNTRLVPLTSAEKLVAEAFKQRVGRGKKKKAAEDAHQAFAYLTLKETSGTLTLTDEDDPRPAVRVVQRNIAQFAGLIAPPTQNRT